MINVAGVQHESEKYFTSYMIQESDSSVFTVYKSRILDNVDLTPITEEMTLSIFEGGNWTEFSPGLLVGQFKGEVGDDAGAFEFSNLMPGQYYIHANASSSGSSWDYGSYLDKGIYALSDRESMNLDFRPLLLNNGAKDQEYDMRVVLTWEDLLSSDSKDLDLFVEFDVNDRHRCNVGFYLPLCYGSLSNFR